MEKGTVILDKDEYNTLRDFKYRIENGDYLVGVRIARNGIDVQTFTAKIYTSDTVIKTLTEYNDSLKKEISRLTEEQSPKEFTIEDIKKMSYWEFRKWKKQVNG